MKICKTELCKLNNTNNQRTEAIQNLENLQHGTMTIEKQKAVILYKTSITWNFV